MIGAQDGNCRLLEVANWIVECREELLCPQRREVMSHGREEKI